MRPFSLSPRKSENKTLAAALSSDHDDHGSKYDISSLLKINHRIQPSSSKVNRKMGKDYHLENRGEHNNEQDEFSSFVRDRMHTLSDAIEDSDDYIEQRYSVNDGNEEDFNKYPHSHNPLKPKSLNPDWFKANENHVEEDKYSAVGTEEDTILSLDDDQDKYCVRHVTSDDYSIDSIQDHSIDSIHNCDSALEVFDRIKKWEKIRSIQKAVAALSLGAEKQVGKVVDVGADKYSTNTVAENVYRTIRYAKDQSTSILCSADTCITPPSACFFSSDVNSEFLQKPQDISDSQTPFPSPKDHNSLNMDQCRKNSTENSLSKTVENDDEDDNSGALSTLIKYAKRIEDERLLNILKRYKTQEIYGDFSDPISKKVHIGSEKTGNHVDMKSLSSPESLLKNHPQHSLLQNERLNERFKDKLKVLKQNQSVHSTNMSLDEGTQTDLNKKVRWRGAEELVHVQVFDDDISMFTYETLRSLPEDQLRLLAGCDLNHSFSSWFGEDASRDGDSHNDYVDEDSILSYEVTDFKSEEVEPDFVVVQSNMSGKWSKFY